MLGRLLNLFRPSIQPSEKLQTFLTIDELDDLLAARYELGPLSKDDEKYIRLTLKRPKK